MSTWSQKRKKTILGVIALLVLIPISFIAFKIFYKPATCSDDKQNQNEKGIDCGGVCELFCREETASPVILWQRLFRISDGVYSAAAYIQNPNLGAGAKKVPYRMRVYDEKGVSMYERIGTVDIHPKYSFPIIEAGLLVGERIPTRMTFEFLEDPEWIRESDELLPLTVTNESLSNETTVPRIQATLQNNTVRNIEKVPVAVIVYDNNNNAIAVSKTVVDVVPGSSEAKVVFTWPEPMPRAVLRSEIIILR